MFTENYNKLKQVANYLGYTVNLVPDCYVSSCGHLTKHINISKKSGETKSIFEFAHELGHCRQFIIVWDKIKGNKEDVKQIYRERDKKKYLFMWNEFEAWLLGYYILKEKEINTYGYWQHAFYCLKSHLFKTKPNSVKG